MSRQPWEQYSYSSGAQQVVLCINLLLWVLGRDGDGDDGDEYAGDEDLVASFCEEK